VPKTRLTDVTLRQLSQEQGQTRYFDEMLPGFGVTVGTRTKTFFVMRGEKRQLTTIGKYPDISLSDARKEAKRLLVQVPQENVSMRLVEAVEAYLADCSTRLRPSSVSSYRQTLRNAPDIPLSKATKKTITATTPHEIKAYKAFFNWCLKEDLIDKNPFQYSSVSFNQRSHVLSDAEIKTLWAYDHPPYSDIIKLCILTGQRVGEVKRFNHAWISDNTITIPSSIAKNGHEHTIPFNFLTAYYLKRYMGKTFNGFSKGKQRMDIKTGVTGYVIHDLRRTFSTTHAKLGTPLHVTEKLLNHVSGSISGVSAIYNRHNYLKEMEKAVLDYELHIATLVGAKA
jgi:integrase